MRLLKPTDVYFLILPKVHILDLAGPVQVFSHPQELENLRLHFIGPQSRVTAEQGIHLHYLEPLPAELTADSWVFVIGSARDNQLFEGAAADAAIKWLRKHDWERYLLGGICSGALLIGQAGLLRQKRCTTHHQLIEVLQQVSPDSQILDNRLFVGDGSIWTSAGITAGIDLCLYLISQYWDHQITTTIARDMVLYLRRTGDDPQLSVHLQYRHHIHPKVHRAQDLLSSDPGKHWSVKTLATEIHLSERHLSRVFREQTGITINAYLQKLRMALVQEMLGNPGITLQQIADKAGFGSDRQFRRLWKQTVGETPIQSRMKKIHATRI